MDTKKRVKWYDGGTECNLCENEAMWSGLCESCKKLPEPRTESKIWNDAILAAAKWLSDVEECFCEEGAGLHDTGCSVVANRCLANEMKDSLLKTKEGVRGEA